ncbi:MAG: ABC transporter ATP-binding protein [Betaproteobacteria bacterium]|nr:ABC transporter ATP-binding protein [Betaproteobacteria bacterium]
MSATLLEVNQLTLRVAARTLVRDLDFRIRAGELWCLLGPNGSGKTTLLHALVGLRDTQGGAVYLAGKKPGEWPAAEVARLRGFLPQTFHDAFSASALDCVMLGRHPHLSRWQWEGEGDREIALASLALVDLDGFGQRDVLTLSGGERQRVALASLFAQDAPLLLLDEPVSHLDLHHQVLMLEHFSLLARERARGILFSVHDLNLAARFASHALLLTPQGTVRQGPIAEVMVEDGLSDAFGHRVARVEAAGRTLFVPE